MLFFTKMTFFFYCQRTGSITLTNKSLENFYSSNADGQIPLYNLWHFNKVQESFFSFRTYKNFLMPQQPCRILRLCNCSFTSICFSETFPKVVCHRFDWFPTGYYEINDPLRNIPYHFEWKCGPTTIFYHTSQDNCPPGISWFLLFSFCCEMSQKI